MIKIAPSILSADFSRLGEEVEAVESAGADYLHIDVMDGQFVPNITVGVPVVKSLRPHSKLFFDVHLMTLHPERIMNAFMDAGADGITVHYEATEHLHQTLSEIRAAGKRAAVSVKPNTPVHVLRDYLDELDMILLMTVEPGFGGQAFLPKSLERIREMKQIIGERPIDLEVDGGINQDNLADVVCAGANVIVSGSTIYRAKSPKDVIAQFRELGNTK